MSTRAHSSKTRLFKHTKIFFFTILEIWEFFEKCFLMSLPLLYLGKEVKRGFVCFEAIFLNHSMQKYISATNGSSKLPSFFWALYNLTCKRTVLFFKFLFLYALPFPPNPSEMSPFLVFVSLHIPNPTTYPFRTRSITTSAVTPLLEAACFFLVRCSFSAVTRFNRGLPMSCLIMSLLPQ